jgi:hypothetical protein
MASKPTKEQTSKYNRQYYLKNREKVAAYKRERYKTNKTYAKKIKERGYLRYKFNELFMCEIPSKLSLKEAAYQLNKPKFILYSWFRQGLIPCNKVKDQYLFTPAQISLLKILADMVDREVEGITYDAFKDTTNYFWNKDSFTKKEVIKYVRKSTSKSKCKHGCNN